MKTRSTEITEPAAPASYESEASAIGEINRLHAEAQRLANDSRQALDAALAAAWAPHRRKSPHPPPRRARRMASLAESCFQGGTRTAQRYMQLARRMDDPASLRGLSLRQACLRLGIPISPRDARGAAPVQKLPAHIMLAAKLTRCLRAHRETKLRELPPELTALYEQLRRLVEASAV